MRKAFSMITAIFIIVLLASIGAFILNISAKTVQSSTYLYQEEQAALYAKSYTELAIMYATANNATTTNCAESIVGNIGPNPDNGEGYTVQTVISYIGKNLQCTDTQRILTPPNGIVTTNSIYIIVDVFVRYKDLDQVAVNGSGTNSPWMTYHRRTLQQL